MNISKELQKIEKLGRILELIQYAEQKIKNFEEFRDQWGMMVVSRKMTRNNEFTKLAKNRLEKYYLNTIKS